MHTEDPACDLPQNSHPCSIVRDHLRMRLPYSFSNPWLVNFNVRLFSVTVRTI